MKRRLIFRKLVDGYKTKLKWESEDKPTFRGILGGFKGPIPIKGEISIKKGEITMAAAIPEGATVRLMIGDRDAAIKAAKTAAGIALGQLGGEPARFILMFNCMARNKLLGVRCNEENQTVQNAIGSNVPMMGFYTYGEQGPLLGKKGTPAYFHNETITLLVIGE